MQTLYVKSLPLKEVVQNLADQLETSFDCDCDVYHLNLPKKVGEGHIFGINFPAGIGMVSYDCRFKKDVRIEFTVNDIHPAKFIYLLIGNLHHRFEGEEEEHVLEQHQSAIVASSDHNGHILTFAKDQRVKMCSIEINRRIFLKDMQCELDKTESSLKDLFHDIEAKHTFYHEGSYSLTLFDKLRGVEQNTIKGFTRKLFLYSTAVGVIYEQILNYRMEKEMQPDDLKVKHHDVQLVRKAVDTIVNSIDKPVNIQALARIVGTNSTKLQQGFKMMYGLTINGFVKKLRLETAAKLLISTDKSVSSIVNEVGLINRGYFSKIFKSHYDATPQAYRIKYAGQFLSRADHSEVSDKAR